VRDPGDGVTFDDLVAAATVGLARRPFAITGLGGPAAGYLGALDRRDQAGALLEAAALLTVAARAGYQPEPGVPGPAPAPEEAAPELSARAEGALRRLGGAQLASGFPAADKELLADLLTAAANAGYVASAPLLPDLLDAAVRTVALRPAVGAVLGARGRWLAGQRPDWQRIVPPPVLGAAENDPERWRTGSPADRRGYLAAARERDPVAGRELLAADWVELAGGERAELLAVLRLGLSAGDEAFIETALDDRMTNVRAIARLLLTRLPGSRFGQRATERGTAALRLERSRLGLGLQVTVPGELDPAAVRDGIDAPPPSRAGGIDAQSPSRADGGGGRLLTQLVAAVPLAAWTSRFGLSPGDIVGLPVAGNFGPDVRAGWRAAAIRQRDGDWAEALLQVAEPGDGAGGRPAEWPDDQRLAAVLAPDKRAARAAALLTRTNLNAGPAAASEAIADVGAVIPWPGPLADAVLAVLGRAAPLAVLPRLPRGLLDLAARGLPAVGGRDYAAELTRLADAHPQRWTPLVRKTAETILLRRAFLEEIR
jgi:Family of unknown function (DUF5691)